MGQYLCPVCRARRDVDLQDHISWRTHAKISLTVLLVCTTAWVIRGPAVTVKLAFLYFPLWAICEFFHWSHLRKQSKCPHCFFDPILYQKDWKAARKIVEDRLLSIKEAAEQRQKERKAHFLGKDNEAPDSQASKGPISNPKNLLPSQRQPKEPSAR